MAHISLKISLFTFGQGLPSNQCLSEHILKKPRHTPPSRGKISVVLSLKKSQGEILTPSRQNSHGLQRGQDLSPKETLRATREVD